MALDCKWTGQNYLLIKTLAFALNNILFITKTRRNYICFADKSANNKYLRLHKNIL